jgi:hypothetical protein
MRGSKCGDGTTSKTCRAEKHPLFVDRTLRGLQESFYVAAPAVLETRAQYSVARSEEH